MHARFELRPAPPEALQTASRLLALLEHGDVIAVSGEDYSARKATKSAADDDAFLHSDVGFWGF